MRAQVGDGRGTGRHTEVEHYGGGDGTLDGEGRLGLGGAELLWRRLGGLDWGKEKVSTLRWRERLTLWAVVGPWNVQSPPNIFLGLATGC